MNIFYDLSENGVDGGLRLIDGSAIKFFCIIKLNALPVCVWFYSLKVYQGRIWVD